MINEPDATTRLPDLEITQQTRVDGSRPTLPAAAMRALDEADARRKKSERAAGAIEIQGRHGPEPVRYGDWEVKGLATDF